MATATTATTATTGSNRKGTLTWKENYSENCWTVLWTPSDTKQQETLGKIAFPISSKEPDLVRNEKGEIVEVSEALYISIYGYKQKVAADLAKPMSECVTGQERFRLLKEEMATYTGVSSINLSRSSTPRNSISKKKIDLYLAQFKGKELEKQRAMIEQLMAMAVS